MTGEELKKIVDAGRKPIICFTKEIENLDLQFEEGMLAEVEDVNINNENTVVEIVVSEKRFMDYNKKLETAIWWDEDKKSYCKKYSEKWDRDVHITIYDEIDKIYNFFIKDGNMDIFNEFLNSGTNLLYIEWLEEKLSEARALI